MKIRYLLSAVVLGIFLTSPGGLTVAASVAPMTIENQVDHVRAAMPTAPEYHPPVADPGGPYSGRIGQEIVLDGSGSYDPDGGMDDAVVLYEWDVAGGRLYTTTEPTLAHTWTVSGTFAVALRVQDRGVDDGFDLPKWSEAATTMVTISEEVPPPGDDGIDWLVVVIVAASLMIIAIVLTVVCRRLSR